MIKSLLTSGYHFNDSEYEQQLKYILFNSLLIFNITLVGIAAIIRFSNSQYMLGIYDAIYVFLGLTVFVSARHLKKYFKRLVYLVILTSFFIVTLIFESGLNPLAGIGWYIILLITTIFLLGEKEGNVVFVFSIITIAYISKDSYNYSYIEIFLGIIPFVVTIFFMHFFQKRNQDAKRKLQIANRVLKNHNSELNNLIQNSSSELYIVDSKSYKFLYANNGALNNIGYTLKELSGLQVDMINRNMNNEQLKLLKEELSLNNDAFKITIIHRKDGSIYPVYAYIHLTRYQGRDVLAVFVSDISELRDANVKLSESNSEILKLTQILDKSPVSIIITDVDGNIEYSNPWFTKLTGYTLEEVKGQNPRVLKSNLHSDKHYEELWDDITHDKIWNGRFKNVTKYGKEYWESAIIAPIKDETGKLTNYIAIKQEITQQVYLQDLVDKENKEKIENFEKTLESFVKIVEERDTYTAGHSQRVATYAQLIARNMGYSYEKCEFIYRAAILHDIGKIATPDNILLKPGQLSTLEYKLIQEHVSTSYDILVGIPMYKEIADIIVHHHERYDGSGYPDGLKGDEISMLSHIMIVADAFDAMTTNRIYKGRKDMAEALSELEKCSGTQFHPKVVKYAKGALVSIILQDTVSQLPTTDLEKERFSYFFRDQVTDTYNADYLRFVLNQNQFTKEFACVNIIYMHNFSKYNNEYGWAAGDRLLIKFSDYLVSQFPLSQIFRIYGDDFVIVNTQHIEIDMEQFKTLDILEKHGLYVTHKHLDLRVKAIVDIEEFEKM